MRKDVLTPGSTFAKRYTIEGFIGRGSHSAVYKATDMQAGKPVALKLFTSKHASQASIDREVDILSRLRHPNIIQFHRYGQTDTVPYIDMELAEGTLRGALRSPRVPIEDAVTLLALTTDAVSYAHDHNVMHRDLKPDSLLYTGTVKVGDWGYGVSMVNGQPQYLPRHDRVIGHPAYMAPEQVLGKATPASDIYVLGGLVAYEAFTGRQAIKSHILYDGMLRQLLASPPPFEKVLKGEMNEVLAAVEVPIRRALAKKQSDRQASMAEYRDELIEAYRKGKEKQARSQRHL